ncbi:MAG: copper chaperone PCu(A)C [Piscinibacter sp.]
MNTITFRSLALAAVALACAGAAVAQTTVKDGWVRSTVEPQKATGAFMQITSAQGGKLVGVQTPAAGVAEVHEMAMDGNVMKMRAVPALDLPAGKAVELKPGSYHLMLMELKQPLKAGDTLPLTLTVEGKDGKRETVELTLPVKAAGAAPAGEHKHKH